MSDPKTVKIRIETEDEIHEYETNCASLIIKDGEAYFHNILLSDCSLADFIMLARALMKRIEWIKKEVGEEYAELLMSELKTIDLEVQDERRS